MTNEQVKKIQPVVMEDEYLAKFYINLDSVNVKPYESICFQINKDISVVTKKDLEEFLATKQHVNDYSVGIISIIVAVATIICTLMITKK